MTKEGQYGLSPEQTLNMDVLRYFRWSGCASFLQLALMHPELWQRLVQMPGERLRVALQMGWRIRPRAMLVSPKGLHRQIEALLCYGSNDPTRLWLEVPAVCNALHQADWLKPLFIALGADPILWEEPSEAAFRRLPDLPGGVRQAYRARPREGWETRGGRVQRLPELMVARFLEQQHVEFETVQEPGAAACFQLRESGVVGFRSDAGFVAARPDGLLKVTFDDALLTSPGQVAAFTAHLYVTAFEAGVIRSWNPSSLEDLLASRPLPQGEA